MHELSVCQNLIGQVDALVMQHSAMSAHRITVQIGPLSGVDWHLLRDAFAIAKAGSSARDAELVLEMIPVVVRCSDCGQDSDVEVNRLLCSQCGSWKTRVLSGEELLLKSVEMETRDSH